jgi:hypothetical protein
MAKGTTNTDSKLPEFPGLKLHEKRAVMLRAEGKTYDQVTNHINTEYALDYSVKTIQEWFQAGGRLEQASSLKEARLLIMRSMKSAAATLISGMNNPDPRIAQEAAKSLLNKYIPDKQIALSGAAIEDELPPELDLAAEEILAGGGDGSEQVDNPPESSSDTPNPGT